MLLVELDWFQEAGFLGRIGRDAQDVLDALLLSACLAPSLAAASPKRATRSNRTIRVC